MRIFLVMFLCLACFAGLGQRSLKGEVFENLEGKKNALPGAAVRWKNFDIGAYSDENGKFKIDRPEGADSLIVSFIGFTTKYILVGDTKNLMVELEAGNALSEAEIVTEYKSSEISLIDPRNITIINEAELLKAACCNLSESFETNAAIDASFTDAVTGTRQIRMLGLDGKYSQQMKDNIPFIRGLSTIYGLTYIPGTWINSIQISKGVGSVTNGFESITGQINVGMKTPENAEPLNLNLYANQGGRVELNANFQKQVTPRLATTLLTHAEINETRQDNNGDGFMDNPLKKDFIIRNEWKLIKGRVRGEYQVTGMMENAQAGQLKYDGIGENIIADQLWGMTRKTDMLDFTGKTGIVFPSKTWKSIGTQVSFNLFDQISNYGLRTYNGRQNSARVNLLYASIIGNTNHKFTTGLSWMYDEYREQLGANNFNRTENVPGAFFEYTYVNLEVMSFIAGVRLDQHNIYGTFFSPRAHFRYSLNEKMSIKLGAGKGYRTSNIILENVGMLASNREIVIRNPEAGKAYGLDVEEAINLGINYTYKFKLNYRDASLNVDYYYTDFQNQVVADFDFNPQQVHFYNLAGRSYSHSAQAEFDWSPARRWNARVAYRWLDVQTDYATPGSLETRRLFKPLVANHRSFANISYETKKTEKKKQWKIDWTVNIIGEQRLPSTLSNPEEFRLPEISDPFVTMNAQITRVFGENFQAALGVENFTNYKQANPIISAQDPFDEKFDASMVYGPVFGRMAYLNLRYVIARPDAH